MKNYRIALKDKLDFDFMKNYLIDNNIGGDFVCIGNYLPNAVKFLTL